MKGIARIIYPRKNINLLQKQKGYVYFQNFISKNDFDDRIIVIGDKAIAVRRMNRKNDFRASGSGIKKYNPEIFPKKTIKYSFQISEKIKSQSIALDFIYDNKNNPLVVEMSYAFIMGPFYDKCPGYWTEDLVFHECEVNPQKFIIESFLNSLKKNN